MKLNIKQDIGWFGMAIILAAYTLNALSILTTENLLYAIMNIFGSAGIICASLSKKDYQPVVLNIVWILVAIFLIIKVLI